MMTNTFTPHVGGVARSVASFAAAYRERGHGVLVVAPAFENMPAVEEDVVRLPAIQNFNGSDFSVVLPVSEFLMSAVSRFQPDVVHAHHPFLVGSTALRVAHRFRLPLVFTHHTMYERYTHYVPGDCATLRRFVVGLSTAYANLCDLVFAPSDSVAAALVERGVRTPVVVVPTGVRLEDFAAGDGTAFRRAEGIPDNAVVLGHAGRLAPEKNLEFLTDAALRLVAAQADRHFLVVGAGPSDVAMRRAFEAAGLADRLHVTGVVVRERLRDAYAAMNLFLFASLSETQGMVLTEAMAAGVPVVALDAPGARELVADGVNGRLLAGADVAAFAQAAEGVLTAPAGRRAALREGALAAAAANAMPMTATLALAHYQHVRGGAFMPPPEDYDAWRGVLRQLRAEWELLKGMAGAAADALQQPEAGRPLAPDQGR